MKMARRLLLALLLGVLVSAHADLIGKSEAELIATKGQPNSKMVSGSKAIYRWDDTEIWLTQGVVTSVSMRDLQKEKESRDGAARANAAMQSRLAMASASQPQQQQPANAYVPDFVKETLAKDAARKANRERDAENDARKRADREVEFARRETLRVETNRLRIETRQAYVNGDRGKSRALAEEYKTKMKEKELVNDRINRSR